MGTYHYFFCFLVSMLNNVRPKIIPNTNVMSSRTNSGIDGVANIKSTGVLALFFTQTRTIKVMITTLITPLIFFIMKNLLKLCGKNDPITK